MSSVVLVTGGAGFIGSHVVDRLAAAGHRVRILDTRPSPWHDSSEVETVIGDVRSLDDVVNALEGCDAVCHLAAAADVGEVHAEPAWATELNAMGTLNVLEAARRLEIDRVIYASTVWVYSDVDEPTVDEDALLPNPAHVYTAGKLSGELYCHSYAELYGLRPTVLRFGIPYGPRARPAAVIPSFVERALRGEALTIAGTGAQERSFIYVEDLAEGVARALSPQAAGRTYNLAGRETTTIRQLAEVVSEEVAPTEIVHTEGRAGDLKGAVICSDRAERELGWQASTPLREGVRRYAAWLHEHSAVAVAAAAPVVPAPVAESGMRRAATRLATVAGDPLYVGAAALIAVASAAVSAILGTADDARAANCLVVALALLVPLWSLTAVSWPFDRRRLQAAVVAFGGAASVVVLGLVSSDTDSTLHPSNVLLLLAVSAAATGVLRAVPRRLADDSA
ncbi:MAG: NAD-dependent epimerase/dehydratase family protein [Solirubrobacterales bacterium]|jgi:UDP-glucose 4-epimerase|nr:NAD-dependent epimerase/dehydratase family protein [Solirubrobacterales bacterium]